MIPISEFHFFLSVCGLDFGVNYKDFPFRVRCVEERGISLLEVGEEVEAVGMLSVDECMHEMFVEVHWSGRTLGMPLAQLEAVDVNDETQEAIEDWRYWVARGYKFDDDEARNGRRANRMPNDTLTCIPGIRVGHATDARAKTGCTVVLCKSGMVAGVDVRGSAPGTREIAVLHPLGLVQSAHAILLTGGSAFGLAAAAGVMRYLEEQGEGFPVGHGLRVPIVPAAVIFDLGVGDGTVRPDAEMGYLACQNASDMPVEQGQIGAGTGATVGAPPRCPGGIGSAASSLEGGATVAALVVVNAFGSVIDPTKSREMRPASSTASPYRGNPFQNTTLGVIATDARLDRVAATKVAQMAHDGLARVIEPIHTLYDGDTIFTVAAGRLPGDTNSIGIVAANVLSTAVLNAVRMASFALPNDSP